jgi:glutaredoxin
VKEFLSRKGFSFEEKDVSRDDKAREEMYRRSGHMAVPTIIVGEKVMVGFDPQRLSKMLS